MDNIVSSFYTLKWPDHINNVNRFLSVSYAEEKYTDVALACDGHVLKAHKIVLAGCSPYFENMFSMYCAPNMCIAIDSVAYPILRLVLEFMYCGEIRVKHSELENLMRAGRHLKVKGLDSIIVSDLQRSEEHTILIARPTDDYQNLQSAMGTRPATHSPEPPKPKIPFDAVHIPVPRPKLKQEPKEALPENADSPDGPSTSTSQEESGNEKLPPISSPSRPLAAASASKSRVGECLQTSENVVTEGPDPSSKRPKTRRVARVPVVDVVSSWEPQNSLPSASNEDAVVPNLEPEKTDRTSEEANTLGMDSGELNITSDEPADQPPATIQSESLLPFPGFVEVTTTRSRIIKKPARIADTEFNFEPEAPKVKKRRTRKVYVQVKVNRPKRKL